MGRQGRVWEGKLGGKGTKNSLKKDSNRAVNEVLRQGEARRKGREGKVI